MRKIVKGLAIVGVVFLGLTVLGATVGGGGGESNASNVDTKNNNSDALLGSLFIRGEDKLTSFNPINETYTEVSYVGNRTIMPPDAITTGTINATETGNLTLNLQPNG